jgi:hypothetical protein
MFLLCRDDPQPGPKPDQNPPTTETELPSSSSRLNNNKYRFWSEEEMRLWEEWNYGENGFVMTEKNLEFPRRQDSPGLSTGLSLLVDSQTEEYFCPSSDSEGFRFMVHNAVEVPNMQDYGMSVGLGNEILIEVNADVTMADPKINEYEYVIPYFLFLFKCPIFTNIDMLRFVSICVPAPMLFKGRNPVQKQSKILICFS